jgi:hypothetical protein
VNSSAIKNRIASATHPHIHSASIGTSIEELLSMLRKQGCLFLVYQIFGLKSDLLNWLIGCVWNVGKYASRMILQEPLCCAILELAVTWFRRRNQAVPKW